MLLPIEPLLPDLVQQLEPGGTLLLQAPPGAGKTTGVPLALLEALPPESGRILMLEPRRLAAKAAAERLASSLGEKVGERVGYRVRLESRVTAATRVEVLTDKDSAELVTRARLLAPELVGLSAGSRRMIGPLADTIARLKAVLPNARICVGGYLTTLEPDLAGIVGADHLSTDAASSAMALRPGSERVGRASR